MMVDLTLDNLKAVRAACATFHRAVFMETDEREGKTRDAVADLLKAAHFTLYELDDALRKQIVRIEAAAIFARIDAPRKALQQAAE